MTTGTTLSICLMYHVHIWGVTKAQNFFIPWISSSGFGLTFFLRYHFIVPQRFSIGLRSCRIYLQNISVSYILYLQWYDWRFWWGCYHSSWVEAVTFNKVTVDPQCDSEVDPQTSLINNVMKKFNIINRTDTWKTDAISFFTAVPCRFFSQNSGEKHAQAHKF